MKEKEGLSLPPMLLIFCVWVVCAATVPVVQDEAYYFTWSHFLDFGYLDHPPFVALMGLTSLAGSPTSPSPFLARLGTLLVSGLTLLATWRAAKAFGFTSRRAKQVVILLAFGNTLGLIFGFLTTPDTGLMLAWILALGEAALALRGQQWRWLTAGLATALGLWSKYTMLVIGPVFVWALWANTRQRRGLRCKWPYLGAMVVLLGLAPHLVWGASHDWVTLEFQLRHGFKEEHAVAATATRLPRATKPILASEESALAAPFLAMAEKEKNEERSPGKSDAILAALNRYFGYYGSQIGLWGAMGVAALFAERRRRKTQRGQLYAQPTAGEVLAPETRPLALAATVVPLLVFGLISLGTKVEANWSAMYVFGAALLLAPRLLNAKDLLVKAVQVHIAAIAIVVAHLTWSILPIRPHRDRLLSETHGFADLAQVVGSLPGPVFADSYQLVSLLRFYLPTANFMQWPGITRDSELIRRMDMTPVRVSELREHGFFWLVTTNVLPPHLLGFKPTSIVQLRDCKDDGLQVISSHSGRRAHQRCKKPIHEWYLLRYEPNPRIG